MSRTNSEKPVFLEIKPGVRIAANVKVPEHLNFREGQNLFDQPPFGWIFADPDLLPWELLSPAVDEDEAIRAFIDLALYGKKRGFWPLDKNDLVLEHELKRYKIKSQQGHTSIVEKYVGDYLDPQLSADNPKDLVAIFRAAEQVFNYLESFPQLVRYLEEYWSNWRKTNMILFNFDGTLRESQLKGTYNIPTYGFFAWQHRESHPELMGLEELLPDDKAALLYAGPQVAWPIIRFMSEN